jgi:predicted ATPase
VHEEISGKLDLSIEDVGEINLKNILRPVRVYRITGEAKKEATSSITQKTPAADAVFVGRQVELDTLRRSLSHATEGRGRLVMLVGEPGIGKSRTAYELASYAAECSFLVLWGRCSEEPGAPPYWPWVQIIRSYVTDCDAETLMVDMGQGAADIVDVVPEIGERLTSLQASATLADPAAARFRLFDAIARFFKNVARRRPLLLVLDDLHWADAPSLRLLQFVGPELEAARCVLLGTYRDIELSRKHPLSDTLGMLTRLHMFERVQLTGLGRDDVARLMESAAGTAPPASLVSAVQAEAEGNPFFLKEIVAYLVQEKVLQPGTSEASDRLGRARGLAVRIPEGVKEVIGKRLNRLSAPCNQMLTVASVVGRQFDFDILVRLLDEQSEDRVLTLLEEALAVRVIDELPPPAVGRYQFSHALIRETLYEELITMRRARLHRRVGEIIEGLHKTDLNSYIPQLAHHFCEAAQAGSADKADTHRMPASLRTLSWPSKRRLDCRKWRSALWNSTR